MTPFRRHLGALALLAFASPAAARFRVCTFVFNGPEEVDVFRARLPSVDFEIVDLSPALATPVSSASAAASRASGTWVTRPGVVMISCPFT